VLERLLAGFLLFAAGAGEGEEQVVEGGRVVEVSQMRQLVQHDLASQRWREEQRLAAQLAGESRDVRVAGAYACVFLHTLYFTGCV